MGRTADSFNRVADYRVTYDLKSMQWTKIFEIHPLVSKKNENLFYEMDNCKEHWGGGNIIVVRPDYTFNILKQIARNSLEDCVTFYEIAKHSMINPTNRTLTISTDEFFKIALTAIYLGNDNAPESLSYLNELSQENKERAVISSFKHYGINTFNKFNKIKGELNIDNLNDKLLLAHWKEKHNEKTCLTDVFEAIKSEGNLIFNPEYIAENLNPKFILRPKAVKVNQNYLPLSSVHVIAAKYWANKTDLVCLFSENQKTISLEIVHNLVCMQSALYLLIKTQNNIKNIDGQTYSTIQDVFNNIPLNKESHYSMLSFIAKNREVINKKAFKGSGVIAKEKLWNEVEVCLNAAILDNNLKPVRENNLPHKKHKL